MNAPRHEESNEFDLLESGLSAELMRIGIGDSQAERLRIGLIRIGVMEESESLLGLRDQSAWHRGGGETFVADSIARIVDRSQKYSTDAPYDERHVIAKALVSFGTTPEVMMSSWLRRRTILTSLQIPVPRLFGAFQGTLYEEFIEDELSPESLLVTEVLEELGRIAAVLDRAGFATLSFMADLRRREKKLYYIDFGFDLGEPGNAPSSNAKSQLESKLTHAQRDLALQSYNNYFGAG